MTLPPKGKIGGAGVIFKGGKGFPDLVRFANTEGLTGSGKATDDEGRVTVSILPRAQKREVPDSAKPVNKEFSIFFEAQPEAVTHNTIAGVFLEGLQAPFNPAAGLYAAVEIAKTVHYDLGEFFFPLTDWKQPGYKVPTGGWAKGGEVICGLEKPFTIQQTADLPPFHFTPSKSGSSDRKLFGGARTLR